MNVERLSHHTMTMKDGKKEKENLKSLGSTHEIIFIFGQRFTVNLNVSGMQIQIV